MTCEFFSGFYDLMLVLQLHLIKRLLTIDNFIAHGNVSAIPNPPHITVRFLQANTKLKIQPMDAGTISALRKRYQRFFWRELLRKSMNMSYLCTKLMLYLEWEWYKNFGQTWIQALSTTAGVIQKSRVKTSMRSLPPSQVFFIMTKVLFRSPWKL